MKMYTHGANTMLEIETFVNANGIQKENIVDIMPVAGGGFMLVYYAE